ncbi:MAG: hypothetical protein IRZ16_06260 [Myxococcaceae bacterium]|nr:hypothetical protein [Myxococcaceae bacterium]
MRATAIVLLLGLSTGCGADRLRSASSELRVTPESLVWKRAWVGYESSQQATVENTGRVDRVVQLSIAGPFSLDAESIDVASGETVVVPVRFAPSSAGHVEGTLSIQSDTFELSIPLRADALLPPECEAVGPCHSATFDPELGTCVDAVLPDETACSTPCLTQGTCDNGECLGIASDCDDGNACTRDACDPQKGCVHLDEALCPVPAVECKVSFCDPATGCGVADAVDGTPCGPADCVTANVCISGQCRQVPVPDGAICRSPSPCQAPGTCHQQQCIAPAPTPLVPVWSYPVPPQRQLTFTGTVDAQHNLYWLECENTACELVSFSWDGVERFRVPLHSQVPVRMMGRGVLVVSGSSVLVASYDVVQSFRTSDGVEEWSRISGRRSSRSRRRRRSWSSGRSWTWGRGGSPCARTTWSRTLPFPRRTKAGSWRSTPRRDSSGGPGS